MRYREITEKYCGSCRLYLTEPSLKELGDCGECFESLTNNLENVVIIDKYMRGHDGDKTQGSRGDSRRDRQTP